MKRIDPNQTETPKLHKYLLGAIGPRPIAFASTVDKSGKVNLAPFSFFNVFSANPPICIFSPARRGRDNTTKHTFENVKEVKEVVINIVNFDIVQQMSLSSTDYEKGVNEFVKTGLTPLDSETITPPRVKESPVQLECKVNDIIELKNEGGAGNLVISEVLMMHINEDVLDKSGMIDQEKIDLVGRMGGNWYCRAHGEALFEVEKPLKKLGIGVDSIPEKIRFSEVLTGNDLGMLGNVEALPSREEVEAFKREELAQFFSSATDKESLRIKLHEMGRDFLRNGKAMDAWKTLLAAES